MSINPYKFTEIKREKYLENLRNGMRRGAAARDVGVTRQTVMEFVKDNSDFAKEIDFAEMDADEEVEDALRMAAISGNVPAAFGWLYNRQPERWQDKRNLQVKTDGELIVNVKYVRE